MVTTFPLLASHMGFQVLAATRCLHLNAMTFCKHCYFKVRLTVIILPKMSQILFSMKSLFNGKYRYLHSVLLDFKVTQALSFPCGHTAVTREKSWVLLTELTPLGRVSHPLPGSLQHLQTKQMLLPVPRGYIGTLLYPLPTA